MGAYGSRTPQGRFSKREKAEIIISLQKKVLFYFILFYFIYLRERVRARAYEQGEGQRGEDKQTPCQDLSQRQMLSRQTHTLNTWLSRAISITAESSIKQCYMRSDRKGNSVPHKSEHKSSSAESSHIHY